MKCSMHRVTEVKTAFATTVVVDTTPLVSLSRSWESVPSGLMRVVVMEGVAFCDPLGARGCPFWSSAWRSAAISYSVLGFDALRAIAILRAIEIVFVGADEMLPERRGRELSALR